MAVALAAALTALLYLSAVPLRLAVCLRVDGAGGRAWAWASRRSRRALREGRPGSGATARAGLRRFCAGWDPAQAARAGLRDASFALKRVRLDSMEIEGVFGGPDAALTALVCGAAAALDQALGAAARGVRLRVRRTFPETGRAAS